MEPSAHCESEAGSPYRTVLPGQRLHSYRRPPPQPSQRSATCRIRNSIPSWRSCGKSAPRWRLASTMTPERSSNMSNGSGMPPRATSEGWLQAARLHRHSKSNPATTQTPDGQRSLSGSSQRSRMRAIRQRSPCKTEWWQPRAGLMRAPEPAEAEPEATDIVWALPRLRVADDCHQTPADADDASSRTACACRTCR